MKLFMVRSLQNRSQTLMHEIYDWLAFRIHLDSGVGDGSVGSGDIGVGRERNRPVVIRSTSLCA
jgi:hypothetical protein